jgi:hypothetical protein
MSDVDALARIEAKLDRLLDPEDGIYAVVARAEAASKLAMTDHEADDQVSHRTIYIALAIVGATIAGASIGGRALAAVLGVG